MTEAKDTYTKYYEKHTVFLYGIKWTAKKYFLPHNVSSSISIKDFVREKKIRNRKKERAARAIFFMKLNTKPLKFKCRLANGGGGAGGRAGRPMQGMGTPT